MKIFLIISHFSTGEIYALRAEIFFFKNMFWFIFCGFDPDLWIGIFDLDPEIQNVAETEWDP